MNSSGEPDFDHKQGIPGYSRGKRWPAWAALAVPFIGLMVILAKKIKHISLPAIIFVIFFFEIATLFIEHHSVIMGHWVYNRSKILGPLIWGIPIEEILIYYLFPPVFVIMIMQIVYQKLNKIKS